MAHRVRDASVYFGVGCWMPTQMVLPRRFLREGILGLTPDLWASSLTGRIYLPPCDAAPAVPVRGGALILPGYIQAAVAFGGRHGCGCSRDTAAALDGYVESCTCALRVRHGCSVLGALVSTNESRNPGAASAVSRGRRSGADTCLFRYVSGCDTEPTRWCCLGGF